MSLPRVRLTVAVIFFSASISIKDCCLSILLFMYPVPSTVFTGMRFTWQFIPDSRFASYLAFSSLSFTPLIIEYSKVTRLPVVPK